jgi:hypothetical protein
MVRQSSARFRVIKIVAIMIPDEETETMILLYKSQLSFNTEPELNFYGNESLKVRFHRKNALGDCRLRS